MSLPRILLSRLGVGMGSRRQAALLAGGVVEVVRRRVLEADLTAIALTQTLTFSAENAIPARALVIAQWLDVRTVFAGGGTGSCVVSLGDAATPTGWFNAENVFTGSALGVRPVPGLAGAYVGRTGDLSMAARVPQLVFTTTVANVNVLTTGDLIAYVAFCRRPIGDEVLA